MSTDLTVQELSTREIEAVLADYDLSVAGEENLHPGDIGMPPRLRISQPNRPIEVGDAEAPAGSIVNTLTGAIDEMLDIVPLVFLPRTRVMWPETFATTNDPQCASDNGDYPAQSTDTRSLTNPQPGLCADCPFSQFTDESPPRCKLQRNFLVMVLDGDTSEPAIFTTQSTGLKSARQLTTLAKTQGLKRSTRLITQHIKDERGGWYVPAFSKGRKLSVPEILALIEARDELQNLIITADVADEMRENGDAVHDGAKTAAQETFDTITEEMPF